MSGAKMSGTYLESLRVIIDDGGEVSTSVVLDLMIQVAEDESALLKERDRVHALTEALKMERHVVGLLANMLGRIAVARVNADDAATLQIVDEIIKTYIEPNRKVEVH